MLFGATFLLLNAFAFPMEQDVSTGSTKAVNDFTPLSERLQASEVKTIRVVQDTREWQIQALIRQLKKPMPLSERAASETLLKKIQHEAKYGSDKTLARPVQLAASSELVLEKVINSAEPFKNTRMQGLENTKALKAVFKAGNWKAVANAAALSAVATAGIATYVALTLNRPPLENENNSQNNT